MKVRVFLWSGESSAEMHGGNVTGIFSCKDVTPKPSK